MSRWASLFLLGLALWASPAVCLAHGDEADALRVHTVYTGQRLGSIAKRYNVTVEAICNANSIERKAPIRPGQKLVIPSRKDKDGSEAKQRALAGAAEPDDEQVKEESRRAEKKPKKLGKPRWHTVYRGQRLGSIAKRYNVTVDAIAHANDIRKNKPIQVGQKLIIPGRGDKDGAEAREIRSEGGEGATSARSSRTRRKGSWTAYQKAPSRRGYVELIGHHGRWKGYVIGKGNVLLGRARSGISEVLTAPTNRMRVHPRLMRLIAEVSDTFGGRPLRVISGYRTTSFVKGSRHKQGRAVDFRIVGVPNEVLRDYLRTFDDVGVGYYPNSTFVHFDVRKRSAFWIDYAGPGEAPRLRRNTSKQPKAEETSPAG